MPINELRCQLASEHRLINLKSTSKRTETEVSEDWSAANPTKNEDLIGVYSILVTMKWEMLKTSRIFHVNAEIKDVMSLLDCPRMTQKSPTPKVECYLAEGSKSATEQLIAQVSMSSSSIRPRRQTPEHLGFSSNLFSIYIKYQILCLSLVVLRNLEPLPALKNENADTILSIFNAECFEVETEVKLKMLACYLISKWVPFLHHILYFRSNFILTNPTCGVSSFLLKYYASTYYQFSFLY
ncbi:unnamed protein product [Hymenolepis diminuta]|uniref:Uncharacterized protein n=1 Tax=Hymenolepis diminuta TaxID=6216 RepID=A0A0R3SI49_HYMDI|nr:unnamed protein product [Hymenolepis diminuta]